MASGTDAALANALPVLSVMAKNPSKLHLIRESTRMSLLTMNQPAESGLVARSNS